MDMNTLKNAELTALQKAIIKEWNKTFIAHPSHRTIAKKLKCSKETVSRAIERYLTLKK